MPNPNLTDRQKQAVKLRARGCCEYCQSQEAFSPAPFAVEHIIPRAADGSHNTTNLALSCSGCHGHKYQRTHWLDRITGKETPLFHPRHQKWRDHFEWNSDFTLMIGLTPTCRATIEALQVNRPGLVNLRRILFLAGKHPTSDTE